VRLLEDGLQDISVSRNRQSWGIPFPADPEQTVYVWFDALINYLSATGYPDPGYERLWPADLHVVGKGITRFHCVIWPAMLLSAGLALPREVWAHGYVQWEGTKMSKSAGTAVSLGEAINRHGPDALRYFLLREVGFEADGNFTWDRFDERYTADLADGLGNLASRSLAMVAKYRGGVVPAEGRIPRSTGTAGARSPGTPTRWMRWICAAAQEPLGAGRRGQPVHPAGRALGIGQGRQGGRVGCRARGLGTRPLSPGGAHHPVHPGQSPSPVAKPRSSGGSARTCMAVPRAAALRRAGYQQTRGAVPQAAECLEVSLSMSKTI
jgi:Methionyl-tRNA synthetase